MTSEPAWQRYQGEVAEFFRSIGLRAETDVPVTGVRGKHDVDVLVQGERAGIHQVWIVECKRLNRAVSKDKVLTLAQIVQDVGADRGILVCERAIKPARSGWQRHRTSALPAWPICKRMLNTSGHRSTLERR